MNQPNQRESYTALNPKPSVSAMLRWARLVAFAVPALMVGCLVEVGGEEDEEELELERTISVAFKSIAICKVKVSGHGTVDVETEYIPRVVWCEMGSMSDEALKAQAIAARTFMYRLVSIRSNKTMRNGQSDQVYKTSRCSGTIPQRFRDAATATAGQVMVQPGGHLHHGYYRGITYKTCAKRPNCYGQPCMSQHGANACAMQGKSATQILNLYYNNPRIARAYGSCTQGGGGNQDCYYGGRRGTCQPSTQACNGTYHGSLCPGAGVQCCMPPDSGGGGDWGSCNDKGKEGTCQQTSKACNGSYVSGKCPGPNNVKCCLPPSSGGGSWGGCSFYGKSGTCQESSQSCGGGYVSGQCPGPSSIKCCLATSWGSCQALGKQGTCQHTSNTCGGSYISGKCPGPSTVKCCLP